MKASGSSLPALKFNVGFMLMPKISKKQITILVLLTAIAAVFGFRFVSSRHRVEVKEQLPRVIGDHAAPIHIVEFIDFQCPACAQGAIYLKKVREESPELIRLQMKYFPLASIHKNAMISARYAECASRQGQFWPFQDELIAKQNEWKNLDDVSAIFEIIAIDNKVDLLQLRECLKDQTVDEQIEKDRQEGKLLRVSSTPSYFVNGKMIVGSKSLQEELTKLLKEKSH